MTPNKPKEETHSVLLRLPVNLYDWISKEAEAKRWSNPTFIIDKLENAKKEAEAHSDH
jgi:hypothetical protein